MSVTYPPKFKRVLVTVGRGGDLMVAKVVIDLGVADETGRRWMQQDDVDDEIKYGQTSPE